MLIGRSRWSRGRFWPSIVASRLRRINIWFGITFERICYILELAFDFVLDLLSFAFWRRHLGRVSETSHSGPWFSFCELACLRNLDFWFIPRWVIPSVLWRVRRSFKILNRRCIRSLTRRRVRIIIGRRVRSLVRRRIGSLVGRRARSRRFLIRLGLRLYW